MASCIGLVALGLPALPVGLPAPLIGLVASCIGLVALRLPVLPIRLPAPLIGPVASCIGLVALRLPALPIGLIPLPGLAVSALTGGPGLHGGLIHGLLHRGGQVIGTGLVGLGTALGLTACGAGSVDGLVAVRLVGGIGAHGHGRAPACAALGELAGLHGAHIGILAVSTVGIAGIRHAFSPYLAGVKERTVFVRVIIP